MFKVLHSSRIPLLFLLSLVLLINAVGVFAAPIPVTPLDAPETSSSTPYFWQRDYWNVGAPASPSSTFVNHPVSLPGGFDPSSLRMDTGASIGSGGGCASTRTGGKTFFGTQDLAGLQLSQLTSLTYSTLVESAVGNTIAIGLNIFVDINGDDAWLPANDAILVYEPYYNVGAISTNTWYTLSPFSASSVWWVATNVIPPFASTGSSFEAWGDIITASGSLEIVNPVGGCDGTTAFEGTGSGFTFVAGQKNGGLPWSNGTSGFVGYLDNITLVAGMVNATFDLTAALPPTATNTPTNTPTNTATPDPSATATPTLDPSITPTATTVGATPQPTAQPLPLCTLLGGGTNNIVRADANPYQFCRILVENGVYKQDAAEIGDINLINAGVWQAVDIFEYAAGGVQVTVFSRPLNICLHGVGQFYYRDATGQPRATALLPGWQNGEYTCATINNAGTVVLVGHGV